MSATINTYAFQRTSDATNIAERSAVYGAVGTDSARDARSRELALAAHERNEIERCRRQNAGRMSSFWSRRTPAAPATPTA